MIFNLLLALALSACSGADNNHANAVIDDGSEIIANDYKYIKSSGDIRIMTYNSFYCKGNNGTPTFSDENTHRFASVIGALAPDVVAIQELDSSCVHRNKRYLLEEISKYTGIDYELFFGSAANFDGGRIGCGLLVKRSMKVGDVQFTPLPGDEPRMLIEAKFPKFTVFATHMDLNPMNRKESAKIINNKAKKSVVPLFLIGDLNDSPTWKPEQSAFPELMQKFKIVSDASGSLPEQPGVTIDYVLLGQQHAEKIAVTGTHVVRRLSVKGEQLDLSTASDHYPVFADIRLK